MTIRHGLRKLLWKAGYEITRFRPDSSPLARRKRLLEAYGIDTVLDVGANTGQYATELRHDLNFEGRIVSFEPLTTAFAALERNARGDPLWETVNCALGDTDGSMDIHIAENSYSSSILDMLPAHIKSAPDSRYTGRERIVVKRLDSIIDSLCAPHGKLYLKVDVQGFESRVLAGAVACLPRIDTIQLEMSLTPLYEGERSFGEMHQFLLEKGYQLVSVEPGFSDAETGRLLQVDGIYRRL